MKSIRIVSAVMAILMVLLSLAACAIGTETTETESSLGISNESAGETELKDDIPDNLKFNGEKIVFISTNEMIYDDMTGEIVDDIIYERNKAVEERFGVTFEGIHETGSTIDKITTAVSGGNSDYDLMEELCWRVAPKFTGNYFRDLRKTEYLDFGKVWWNQSFNDVVEYNDAQFGVTGAMVLSLYRRTYVTIFNKDLFTRTNQSFLYEYVENGTWTLDKQAALVPLFHQDNGNNVQDKTGDIYGFVSNDFIFVDPYWASCEVDIIKKNNDGDYEWVFDPGKLHEMAEKVLHLYYATDDGSYIEHDDYQAEQTVSAIFSGGYAAMATICIQALESGDIRNMSEEYGVVPIPKFSEDQKTYRSQMHDGFSILCIPTTISEERSDMLSAILEAMASTSYRIVRPVYYETVLRTQIAKDPQSAEMMDLIINNIYIDAGFVYSHSMNSFHQGFQQLVDKGQNDAISRYTRLSTAAKRALEKLVKQLDKLANQS